MKKLIILILTILVFKANATTYYVSNTGSDLANGTSESSPWLTINKVNTSNFIAGDQILFKSGDAWREILTVPSSGNSGSYITFGSYGTGNKPRILGSELETSWTNSAGNIWISTKTFTDPYVPTYKSNIYFIETNGSVNWGRVKKANTGACTAEYDWTWASNHIYIYSPTDPNTRYSGIEVSQRLRCISLNDKEYIEIDGLELAYSGSYGIGDLSEINISGLIIKNCHIHHIGIKASLCGYGIEENHSNVLIQNNIIHDSGRRNISLDLYGNNAQVHDITIEDNTLYDSFHTTGVDINSQAGSSITNVIIRRNFIYNTNRGAIDNVENYGSAGIYCSRDGSGDVGNISVYNNIFKNCTTSFIALGGTGGTTGMFVYNNTFYGIDPNLVQTYQAAFLIQAGSIATFKNNIFYNDVQPAINSTFSLFNIVSDAGTIILDNNLYYNTEATRLISWYGTSYPVSQWATYKSASGQDAHSIISQNPNFISSSDYNLQATSPAINEGVDVGLTTDYLNNSIQGLPDIGAYEYIAPISPIVRTKGISAGNGKMWSKNGIVYGVQ